MPTSDKGGQRTLRLCRATTWTIIAKKHVSARGYFAGHGAMSARNSAAKFQQMMIFHMFERYGESLRAATLCPRRVASGRSDLCYGCDEPRSITSASEATYSLPCTSFTPNTVPCSFASAWMTTTGRRAPFSSMR